MFLYAFQCGAYYNLQWLSVPYYPTAAIAVFVCACVPVCDGGGEHASLS